MNSNIIFVTVVVLIFFEKSLGQVQHFQIVGHVYHDSHKTIPVVNAKVWVNAPYLISDLSDNEGKFQLSIPKTTSFQEGLYWDIVVEKEANKKVFKRLLDERLNTTDHYELILNDRNGGISDSIDVEKKVIKDDTTYTLNQKFALQIIGIKGTFLNLTGQAQYESFSRIIPEAIYTFLSPDNSFRKNWWVRIKKADVDSLIYSQISDGRFFLLDKDELGLFVDLIDVSHNRKATIVDTISTGEILSGAISVIQKLPFVFPPKIPKRPPRFRVKFYPYSFFPIIYGKANSFDDHGIFSTRFGGSFSGDYWKRNFSDIYLSWGLHLSKQIPLSPNYEVDNYSFYLHLMTSLKNKYL